MNRRFPSSFGCLLSSRLPRRPSHETEPAAESAVAATVGDDPVNVAEAQRMMDLIFPDKKPAGDLLPMAQAQVLEEIVNRRLVLAYARRVGDAPSAEDWPRPRSNCKSAWPRRAAR